MIMIVLIDCVTTKSTVCMYVCYKRNKFIFKVYGTVGGKGLEFGFVTTRVVCVEVCCNHTTRYLYAVCCTKDTSYVCLSSVSNISDQPKIRKVQKSTSSISTYRLL